MRTLCACLLLAVAALAQQPAPQTSNELTIERIFAPGGLTGQGPQDIKWSPDGTKLSFVQRDDSGQHGQLLYVDPATGKTAVLVTEQKLQSLAPPASTIKSEIQRENAARYGVAAYQWAPDSEHLLFDANGQLWLYDLGNETAFAMTSSPDPLRDPKFSPDGKLLAYVRKHNLYVQKLKDGTPRQLTKDEDPNVLNGEVDWVYEEELDVRSNYFWSPDGKQIAFLQMNETAVPSYPITDYLGTHATLEQEKFPQSGDPNPVVRLGVIATAGGKPTWITLPIEKHTADPTGTRPREAQDFYVPRFGWVRDGIVWVQVLNRAQNQLDLYFADAHTGQTQLMLRESDPGWIEVTNDFRILPNGQEFLWTSWRDGHTHIYLYSFSKDQPFGAQAKLEQQLTKGDWEVEGIKAFDPMTGWVYFQANKDNPVERQIYRVKLDGSAVERVSKEAGSHSAEFPDAPRYYVDGYSALLTPPRLSLCNTSGECRQFHASHDVAPFKLIAPQWVHYTAVDGSPVDGFIILPPNVPPGTKIPLILNPYGGPGTQDVTDSWIGQQVQFDEYLAMHGYAVLKTNDRGMTGHGQKFAEQIMRKFGSIELADQLAVLKQALEQFPQLDPNRVGIWGWSFGGYLTTYAMTHSDAFKAGVAVAPVTAWELYDSIYTERYMGIPEENKEAYDKGSSVKGAAGLHGDLLIVHGTSDDNVHMQNTIQFLEALIKAGKSYRLLLYPGKTHGIAGATDRNHLFHRIEEQFDRALKPSCMPAACR